VFLREVAIAAPETPIFKKRRLKYGRLDRSYLRQTFHAQVGHHQGRLVGRDAKANFVMALAPRPSTGMTVCAQTTVCARRIRFAIGQHAA